MSADTPARFSADGEPLNLAAAALDALEWLRVWGTVKRDRLSQTDEAGLERYTTALGTFLQPHLPHEFEQAGDTEKEKENER